MSFFRERQWIQYKHKGKFVEVQIFQVLRNGIARFYVEDDEIEIDKWDTHLYKIGRVSK